MVEGVQQGPVLVGTFFTGVSPSELRGTGHLEPLVPQFAGHPHETASLLSA